MVKLLPLIVLLCTIVVYIPTPVISQCTPAYNCQAGGTAYSPCGGPEDGTIIICPFPRFCVDKITSVTTPPTSLADQSATICSATPATGVIPAWTCSSAGIRFGFTLPPNTPNTDAARNDYCKYYYQCNQARQLPTIEECQTNQHFSVTNQMCMAKDKAGCVTSPSTPGGLDCSLANLRVLDEDSSSCTKYKICDHQGQRVSASCTGDQYYNTAEKACKTGTRVCGSRPNPPAPPTPGPACTSANQRFADEGNCKKFFTCTSSTGTAESRTCPFEYYFNDSTKKCGSDATICGTRKP